MKQRQMTLDLAPDDEQPPMPGETLATARKVWLIVASREVESRVWCNRWRITLEYVGPRDTPAVLPAGDGRVRYSDRYAKGETPAEYFASIGRAA